MTSEVQICIYPILDELLLALSKLKAGKAGGRTGIVPELLKHGGAEMQDRWRDATVVPIPKKGDL